MEVKTPNIDKLKAKNMALKAKRDFRDRETGAEIMRKSRPAMNLVEKPSAQGTNIMEPAAKSMGRTMASNFTASRNQAAMDKVRAGSPMTFAERNPNRMPENIKGGRFFKELNIRDWADKAEAKSKLASAKGKMVASNTNKLKEYWSK